MAAKAKPTQSVEDRSIIEVVLTTPLTPGTTIPYELLDEFVTVIEDKNGWGDPKPSIVVTETGFLWTKPDTDN